MANTSGLQATAGGEQAWQQRLRISSLAACLVVARGLFTGDRFVTIVMGLVAACQLMVLLWAGRKGGKQALVSARSVGKFGWYGGAMIIGLLTLLQEEFEAEAMIYLGLFALAEGGVMVSAKKLLVIQEGLAAEEIRWLRIAAVTAVWAVVVPVLLYVSFFSGLSASRMAANQSSAVFSMRKIRDCLSAYASAHPEQGLPKSLREVGPENTGCVDERLVEGERVGYRFTYDPAAAEPDGKITRYTVTARPRRYGRSGQGSYFSDESGAIRYTYEDRAAHAEDALLE